MTACAVAGMPMSNMVDGLYGVRGGKLEPTWPVAARGTVR